ncbi:MAG: FKBP-type peptidyl-prolyl cis-trans isomerase [bacterium]|nr:FKBP-type peptidyl-prolyl cis-trans isomerase [bacterium]
MSTKSIVIWVVIIIIVLAGGYFIYTNMGQGAQPLPDAAQGAAPSDEQVQGQDVTVGTGDEATPGSVVSVLYTGTLPDGTIFDSSEAHDNEPLVFTLGEQGLIPGFQIGINGMKVGGERLLSIPPSLAYGAQDVTDADGNVIIPANSTLVFNIKLVDVTQAAGATDTPEATQ